MMMNLIEQLKEHEGFRAVPYLCTAGHTTIGYGRNLDAKPLTEDEAEFLLEKDVKEIRDRLSLLGLLSGHNPPRQAVLVNMAYNLGVSGLMKFKKMRVALDQHAYSVAAREMLDSRWAKQVGARAEQLAIQMQSGEWS